MYAAVMIAVVIYVVLGLLIHSVDIEPELSDRWMLWLLRALLAGASMTGLALVDRFKLDASRPAHVRQEWLRRATPPA